MKITYGIIAYLLREGIFSDNMEFSTIILQEKYTDTDAEVKRIRIWRPGLVLQSDTFYLAAWVEFPKELLLSCKEKIQFLFTEPFGKELSENGEEGPSARYRDDRGAGNANLLWIRTNADMSEISEMIQENIQALLRWDAAFSEGILREREAGELFALGMPFLRRDYAVVDVDMNIAYCTPGYAQSRSVKGGRMAEEVFQDLIAHKEFHDAADRSGVFYYYTAEADTDNLCRNIFVNGQYIARLVMILRKDEKRVPAGSEQIFEVFADHLQEMYSHMNLMPVHRSDDNIHRMCLNLLGGMKADLQETEDILSGYRWKRTDRFTASVLRFSGASGWDAQLLTMLPYLASSLERLWSYTCAVPYEGKIILVANHTAGERIENRRAFFQKLAYFVRDNICKAGISPEFSDFSQLHEAVKAAAYTLEAGAVRRPDLWYYLFDDYRLGFYADCLKKELPSGMLCHPAVEILENYDRLHSSELSKTLLTYMQCGLNMSAAAEKLYIHRTSFCRRMNRIRKLTSIDPEDPDTILAILISYGILSQERTPGSEAEKRN